MTTPVAAARSFSAAQSNVSIVPEQTNYPWQRWLVLGSFGLFAGFNAFFYMNFSAVTAASTRLFDISTQTLAWQYSATLIASLPTAFPAMHFIKKYNYIVTGWFMQ
jgi:hypothetical protein